ncbi:unnamed protein product, partial [Phaeothamnion confervicola]
VSRAQIRLALLSWLDRPGALLESAEPFLRTKLAVVLALLVKADYPRVWGSAFPDLITLLQRGPAYIDLFLRFLCAVDEEIVAFHVDRTREEVDANTIIKDALRTPGGADGLGLTGLCAILFEVVGAYREGAQVALAVSALEVCQRYIGWIEITEVANEHYLPLFYECLRSQHAELSCAACGCLLEMVNKGMEDPLEKLSLLQRLQPLSMVREVHMEEEDIAAKAAQLIDAVGQQLLQCWDKLEPAFAQVAGGNGSGSGTPTGVLNGAGGGGGDAAAAAALVLQKGSAAAAVAAAAMLNEVMPLFWLCVSHEQVEVASAMMPTVARLLQTLKRQVQAAVAAGAGAAALA